MLVPMPITLTSRKEGLRSCLSSYLMKKGVSKDRITTTFYGESRPKDTNDTKEGRQNNRRVEFTILTL